MAEDRAKCLASGCSAYLSKPVPEDILLRTVSAQLSDNVPSIPNPESNVTMSGGPTVPDTVNSSAPIKSTFAHKPRIMEIVPEFVGGLPGKVREMLDFLEHRDLPALGTVAHQLLGTCAGYGFGAVSQPASELEQSIKAGGSRESVTANVRSLIEVIRRIDGYDDSKANDAIGATK